MGAVDTIVDIVCAAAGCEALGVDRWMASPLNVGSGTVECAHGTLPVPAPATLALLGDAPVYAAGPAMERVTPTGAAMLRMLDVEYGPLPAMRVTARVMARADARRRASRICCGCWWAKRTAQDAGTEPIAVIETVIDDSTPQLLAYVSELLLEAGAWDVYRAAVQMKKGRTGVQMTVLCRARIWCLRCAICCFARRRRSGCVGGWKTRLALAREFVEVETAWGKVRIKIARWPSGEVANASPEYEDCRRLPRKHGVPLKQVMQEAMRVYAIEAAEKKESADGSLAD